MAFTSTTAGLLIAAWLAYFGLHSLLASLRVKCWVASRVSRGMPAYRLFFNLLAVLLLLPVLGFTYSLEAPLLWQWKGGFAWVANAIALLAIGGFFWTLRYYDGSEFLGTRQWRERSSTVEDQESFRISPAHRFVRHPWYSLGLLILWTRDVNWPWLISLVAISLYFILGLRLEERKLVVYYGEVYRRYRKSVPGLIPRPWRYLDSKGAEDLLRQAEQDRGKERRDAMAG